ncbi:MAG: DUF748 domain-containing protein [Candidatus Omnitrophica bacterium]|nr:DUF748 domain-containing protein [Candidatus Omnitrophota bacterium]
MSKSNKKKWSWLKKRLVLAFVFFVFFVGLPSIFYWQTMMMSVVLSALNSQYGVTVKYDKLELNLIPCEISILFPRIMDSLKNLMDPIAFADGVELSISTRKALRGQIDVHRVHAENLFIDVTADQQGRLNWIPVIERFRSQKPNAPQTLALAQPEAPSSSNSQEAAAQKVLPAASPIAAESPLALASPVQRSVEESKIDASSTSPMESGMQSHLKVPIIDIEDLLLNYHDQRNEETLAIRMDRFTFDPRQYDMTLINPLAYQVGKGNPVLSMKRLRIQNALALPGTPLHLTMDTVHLNGRQIGPTEYDFHFMSELWIHVYRKVGEAVKSRKEESQEIKTPIGSLQAINVSTEIYPLEGGKNSPGALTLSINDVSYLYSKDELVLLGVVLTEAGKTLLRLDRIVLDGLATKNVQIQNLAMSGGRMDIYEDQEGGLNLIRALEMIRSIIDSLAPKEERTASARTPFLEALRTASLHDNMIIWHRENLPVQQIALGQLQYTASENVVNATDFLLSRRNNDKNTIIAIPEIIAYHSGNLQEKTWNHLILNEADFQLNWLPDYFDLITTASDWISLPGRVRRGLERVKEPPNPRPYLIADMQINEANVRLMDYTMDPPIRHRLSSFNLRWSDMQLGRKDAPMTPLIVEAALAEPSAGSVSFQGSVSPSGFPFNIKGDATLSINEMTVLNPYLSASEKALPVRVTKGSLRTNASAAIVNNYVNGIVDLYLINPVFEMKDSNWPLQIDQKTVINTLNKMKDKNGVLAFPNNTWTGDIRDPKFKRGLGLNDLFWSNIQGGLATVFNLPFDIVGSFSSVVKKLFGQ